MSYELLLMIVQNMQITVELALPVLADILEMNIPLPSNRERDSRTCPG